MKKILIDTIVIVIIASFLIILNHFEPLESNAKFMFIPILIFYFFGQYVGRRYKGQKLD